MKNIFNSRYFWIYIIGGAIVINLLASFVHTRIDLTAEKRFTLTEPSKNLIAKINEPIEITILLDGDMPAGFKRLRNTAGDLLTEFKQINSQQITFKYLRPSASDSTEGITMDSLIRLGMSPTNVRMKAKEGEGEEQRYLFPGALVKYQNRILPIDFLQGTKVVDGDPFSTLNAAEALMEYKFASTIEKITRTDVANVGYLIGNGQPLNYNVYDLIEGVIKPNYGFGFIPIDSVDIIPLDFDAVVMMKPTLPFTDRQKLKLDQYIMNGGKVLWMVDKLYAEMDSLMRVQSDFVAFDRDLKLDDILFKYGVRLNSDLVQDLQSDQLPLVIGNYGNQPQMQLAPWYYFPLLSSGSEHPIVKNLDYVLSLFPQSLDTVESAGIKKTVLLNTSNAARILSTPAIVSLNSVKTEDDLQTFKSGPIPIAILLEGKFKSLYSNRLSKSVLDSFSLFYEQPYLSEAMIDNKMIVISDADVASNVFTQQQGPLPMGMNQFTQQRYANHDFLANSIDYLVNNSGILMARNKDYSLRLLDPKRVETEKGKWQLICTVVPVLTVMLFGAVFQQIRRRKYQS
jgi:ABC-2 type transport system permease protein